MQVTKIVDRLMRVPLRGEYKALLEKIDLVATVGSTQDASRLSYTVMEFLAQHRKALTRYERFMIHRRIHELNLDRARASAMSIVMDEKNTHQAQGTLAGLGHTPLSAMLRTKMDLMYAEAMAREERHDARIQLKDDNHRL